MHPILAQSVSFGRGASPAGSIGSLPPITPLSESGALGDDVVMGEPDVKPGTRGTGKRKTTETTAPVKTEPTTKATTAPKVVPASAVLAKVKVCACIPHFSLRMLISLFSATFVVIIPGSRNAGYFPTRRGA